MLVFFHNLKLYQTFFLNILRTQVFNLTNKEYGKQFKTNDERSPIEILKELLSDGYIPSYCTACYRKGRTGDRFMSLCKSGQIANCCQPNALMTLKEYLEDYASDDTTKAGEDLIQKEVKKIPRDRTREIVGERLAKIEEGERDFRF